MSCGTTGCSGQDSNGCYGAVCHTGCGASCGGNCTSKSCTVECYSAGCYSSCTSYCYGICRQSSTAGASGCGGSSCSATDRTIVLFYYKIDILMN